MKNEIIKVPFVNLSAHYLTIQDEIMSLIENVLKSGQYVLGAFLEDFEKDVASYCGTKYAVGVANGTDALILSLKALGIKSGDEVITAPNSFLSSASSIALVGAKPIFVDVRDDFNINPFLIEEAITSKTRAIIPVHLTGRPAEMNHICEIANKHNLFIIEDCAQAFGAKYYNKSVGSFGDTGCFSFHPLKNLSCYGDGGLITTNSEDIYKYLIKARNHGLKSRSECEFWGLNSRLDSLQASILKLKLKYIDNWNLEKRKIATSYIDSLKNVVDVPIEKPYEYSVYQTFMIRSKNNRKLQNYLLKNAIDTKIHYDIPIHLQESAGYLGYKQGDFPVSERHCNEILSLPIYPELTTLQREAVINGVKSFYE